MIPHYRFKNIFVSFVDWLAVFFALGQLKRFLSQFSLFYQGFRSFHLQVTSD